MADPIELLIQGHAHELGPGFAVRRVLPSAKRRMVGPFIFFDHFGPMVVPPGGDGMAVRPHPHIGLATVTYLFDGGIFHRDSLGYAQAIRPGDVNWMTAGAGIAHSERTEPEMRRTGFRMHGIQTWVALPKSHEETAPSFEHVEAAKLPAWQEADASLRLIVGTYGGRTAPTTHFSPIFYVSAELQPGAKTAVSPEHAERAVYVADGEVALGDRLLGVGDLAVLAAGAAGRDRGRCRRRQGDAAGRRADGWAAPYLVELRVVEQGAHREGEGRLARGPLRQGAGRSGIHPAAGQVTSSPAKLGRWARAGGVMSGAMTPMNPPSP